MLHFIKNKGQYLSGSGTGFIKSVYTKVDYYRETQKRVSVKNKFCENTSWFVTCIEQFLKNLFYCYLSDDETFQTSLICSSWVATLQRQMVIKINNTEQRCCIFPFPFMIWIKEPLNLFHQVYAPFIFAMWNVWVLRTWRYCSFSLRGIILLTQQGDVSEQYELNGVICQCGFHFISSSMNHLLLRDGSLSDHMETLVLDIPHTIFWCECEIAWIYCDVIKIICHWGAGCSSWRSLSFRCIISAHPSRNFPYLVLLGIPKTINRRNYWV